MRSFSLYRLHDYQPSTSLAPCMCILYWLLQTITVEYQHYHKFTNIVNSVEIEFLFWNILDSVLFLAGEYTPIWYAVHSIVTSKPNFYYISSCGNLQTYLTLLLQIEVSLTSNKLVFSLFQRKRKIDVNKRSN